MTQLRLWARWLADPLHLSLCLVSLLPMILVLVYVMSYRLETPFRDEWNLNGRVAIAAVDGTLTLDTIDYVAGGHRTIFTNLLTALSAVYQHWNLRTLGLLTPLLALMSLGLLLALFRRFGRGGTLVTLVPFSLLIFAFYRTYNWWSVRQSHWTMVNVWFLAVVLVTARERLTWRGLLLALVLAVCCTYTSAAGMMVWPLAVLIMIIFGQRDWRYYGLWIVSGTVSIAVYLYNSGMLPGLTAGAVNSRDAVLSATLPNVKDFVEFTLKFLGNALLPYEELGTLAAWLAVIGLVLMVGLAVIVWRSRGLKVLAPWLAVAAFSVGSGILIGLARIHENAVDRAFTVQYIAAAGLFWIALIALMVLAAQRFSATRWGHALGAIEVILAFGFFGVYGFSTFSELQNEAFYWGHGLTLQADAVLRPDETCVENFLFTRDEQCLYRVTRAPSNDSPSLDQLAVRRLSIFANMPAGLALPIDYRPDSPVVIASHNAWINVHTRDLLLEGVDNNSIFNLVGDQHLDEVTVLPTPLLHVETGEVPPAAFADALVNARQLWLLRTPDALTRADAYVEAARQAGFVPVFDRSIQLPNIPIPFQVSGFARVDEAPHTIFRFGDHITLQGWLFENSVDVRQCDTVSLQSLWSTDATPPLSYVMTAVIAGSDGVGVARTDRPISIRMATWQPGQVYLDRRSVTVPCDLAAGDYSLLIGLYDAGTTTSLTATSPDGSPVGGLVYLTTLHVQAK